MLRQSCSLRSSLLFDTTASQIVEFAIALPLLIVLVVGIFDFGTAFNVKQKIVNAAREGARIAASQPTMGLNPPLPNPNTNAGTCTAPATVCAVRDAVDNALITSNVKDCGLSTVNATSSGPLVWAFSPVGCAGPMTLTINRGLVVQNVNLVSIPPFQANYNIEMTQVTLNYPYQWTFNRVVQLLVSGANYPATSQLSSVATMQNLN
jgi:Flp pilus assembly protein TadG